MAFMPYKILSIKIPGMFQNLATKIPGMFQFCETMACNIYNIADIFNHGIQNHIQQKNSENSKNSEKFSFKRKNENTRKIS